MAFDMCRFKILFTKIETKLSAVVTRVLILVYESQYAWVHWGNNKSSEFTIKNGTRQGSVLSPALFTVYIQELVDQLQGLGTAGQPDGLIKGSRYLRDLNCMERPGI